MTKTCRDLSPALLAVFAGLLPAAAGAGQRRGKGEKLVPASFSHKTDSMGFRWDVSQSGTVNDGSNDCFDGGLALSVGGNQFNAQNRLMTPDGREYVLSGTAAGVKVTRRILVDLKRAAARYIETFENTGNVTAQLVISIRSQLGGSCTQVVTSAGAVFQGKLGAKDVGIVTVSSSNRPCVMFLVAGLRSKVRPVVAVKGGRTFTFTYFITVKPGKTVSLVHLVAQRRGVTAATAAGLFKGFFRGRRLLTPEIPRHLRRTVANFRVGSGGERGEPCGGLKPVLDLAEQMDVERGTSDVLVIGEEGRLKGTATCGGLAVETAYGRATLDFKAVALLVGGAGLGRRERVYLRDGEVLAGAVKAEGMAFTSEAGMEMELTPAGIDMLFTRAAPEDGRPAPGVGAFVVTRLGERLALSDDTPAELEMATPWGPLRVALEEVRGLSYVREPQPCHRLALADGSRLSVILTDREIRFTTRRFGPVALAPQDIEALRVVAANRAMVIVEGAEVLRRSEEPEWARAIRDKLKPRVTFEFVDTPLAEAIQFLQTLLKISMILDPAVIEGHGNTPVNLKVSDMTLGLALPWILKLADLEYVIMDEAVFISVPEVIEAERRRNARTALRSSSLRSTSRPAALSERAAAARLSSPKSAEPRWKRKLRGKLERKMSFEFIDMPVREAVDFLANEGKTEVVLPDEVLASVDEALTKITFRATDMSFGRALTWTTRLAGLDFVLADGEIQVTKGPEKGKGDDKGGRDESEIAAPHFVLAGDNVLVGSIDLPEIRIATATGTVTVDPAQVHCMRPVNEEGTGVTPSLSFEFMDGSHLPGRLADPVLPIRAGGRTFNVPVRHVREFRAPKAPEPDADEFGDDKEEAGESDPFLQQVKRALKEAGYDPGLAEGGLDEASVTMIRNLLDQLAQSGAPNEVKSKLLKRLLKDVIDRRARRGTR